MNITKYEKYFFILPAILSILAISALVMWGLKPGIDLAGGSLLQIVYPEGRPESEVVREAVRTLDLGEVRVQPTDTAGYILRQRDLTNDERNTLLAKLGTLGRVQEQQFTSVGPSLGAELLTKAWIAIALIVVSIILFIAFAFRHVLLAMALCLRSSTTSSSGRAVCSSKSFLIR